jgi:starch synthase
MSRAARRVLFVSSEVAPFSKTGGLADISAALPRALAQEGCELRVLTPRYGFVNREQHGIRHCDGATGLRADFRGRSLRFGFSRAPRGGEVETYFVECDPLYDRPGLYVDPFTNGDYIDNDYRFILLSRAALQLCRVTAWEPDVIHCHDWQSALAAFLVSRKRGAGAFARTRTLLTIHNIAYHGLFGPESVNRIGDGAERFYFPGGPLEFYGHVNFLKAGLEFADMLNTVSPTYAREIQSSYEYGYGLEAVLRARGDTVAGILNGLDTDAWNPATDAHLAATYDADSLENKERNKLALCARLGLSYDASVPLLGSVSRIAGQKGFEILIPVLSDIFHLPARMVLLGSGDPHLEHVFHEFARLYPDRFAVRIGYDEGLAHLIEAGADIFLMPSKYEPCGLNQMMSMRYGTLPVVRATGGLADTVVDASDSVRGTGFSFREYRPDALLQTVRRAVKTFRDRERWMALQRNAMAQDFSWAQSARRYRELYDQCLQNPPRVVA